MSYTKKIVHVPHLGGIFAGIQVPSSQPAIDPAKPTVILVNSFATSAELFRPQFANKELTDTANLLAIELLGHGQTRTARKNWTYWDTAEMNLQVMNKLGIEKAFVLGTSQGGWITVRMAIMAPRRILGIIPLGTSMDSESPRTVALGCWDVSLAMTPGIQLLTSPEPIPDFALVDPYIDPTIDVGLGKDCAQEDRDFWRETMRKNYLGDDGRQRFRMAAINLRDRDGLHGRLVDVRCPVLWMHGTNDAVYSVANATEEIELFTNAPEKQLVIVKNGYHFLSASNLAEVDTALLEFI
ncbi:hydrolase, alpha/beta fold family [Rhizodiscina lignyota]|uniref:Hydrolase, alpha/beta fold family n=1 Tax=Rhizodiscina lignyota TaxID=1504668 RepID=A0A9P4M818_9PEZI|nr:hydrolase, alpha/beta fold family [Rhizodiscina lignyota]